MSAEPAVVAPLGAFDAPLDDLRAALDHAVVARLPELGVIAVEGADAVAFLQNQLTSDVARLGVTDFGLNGYCTPKGRMLATFHQWKADDRILLQLPVEILEPVRKRLSMFVLRSKAKLADVSDSLRTWAVVGPGAGNLLKEAGLEVPVRDWTCEVGSGLRVARLPASVPVGERFLVIASGESAVSEKLSAAPCVDSGVWWWSEIAAAIPTVFRVTQEKFVPQMINYEVLGGVDFKKGCYPGQEIVARSQYLGKLKRRMHLAHVDDAGQILAGGDVYSEGVEVGLIVLSAAAPGGGHDLLFEAPVDRVVSSELRLGGADGPVLHIRPLPYELFDPTA